MKIIKNLIFFSILILSFTQAQNHSLFTEILQDYVSNGKVNYKELKDDGRLTEYLKILSKTDPDTISDKQNLLSFWINAYNAFTLKVICDNYPLESINDLHSGGLIIGTVLGTTVWDDDFIVINGKTITLNEIEHDIIRPEFSEPRAHFALVCASKSCPPLRPEAYQGDILNQQLDDQGKIFLGNELKNRFDAENKTVYISKIFSWFDDDFGDDDNEILAFIYKFLPDSFKAENPDLTDWEIEHLDYDWSLNE